ncbi:MAG: TIGR04014 family B12-binding domain/radical SAM domain-containing protein [Methanopyri archaeon]|nr:TIGR04014 family B12-binding domain/radical SAM domain-containing protein [Methanopyri archaeon]
MRPRVLIYSPDYHTLGSMIAAGVLSKSGCKVKQTREPDTAALAKADVLALSLYSTLHLMDENVRSMVETAVDRGLTVLIGGPVSHVPDLVLHAFPDAVVVKGEAETVLPEVAQVLKEEADWDDVTGVAYRHDDETVDTGWPPPADLDGPSPLRVPKRLHEQDIRGANVYIETHRGCPGACTFCQVPEFFGRRVRWKPVEAILEEVKALMRGGARRFAVAGGTVTTYGDSDEDFVELLRELSNLVGRENLAAPDVRVDLLNETLLEAILRYTIGWIFPGIESGSDRVLKAMRKGINVDTIRDAVWTAKTMGVKVAGSFIVGYPGETEEDFEMTEELVMELQLDDIFVNIAEPIPGTELCREILERDPEEIPILRPGDTLETEAGDRSLQLQLTGFSSLSRPIPLTDDVFASAEEQARKDERKVLRIVKFLKEAHERGVDVLGGSGP